MMEPTPLTPVDEGQLGIFEGSCDVGQVAQPGSARYDPLDQTYYSTGTGPGDRFHCL